MSYNFDTPIDRANTGSAKHRVVNRGEGYTLTDEANLEHGDNRVIQLWVADMDFRAAPPIIDALQARLDHGIFGYTSPEDSYFEAITSWYGSRYGWEVEKEWIVHSPGVVSALNALVRSETEVGDKVLIQPPVYFPFQRSIEQNGRTMALNPLIRDDETGRYTMDFIDLAEKAADPAVKLAILCSPHNPVGRVWTPEELQQFADICIANDVTIVSDELHCDLIFSHAKFTPMAMVNSSYMDNLVTCMAPSKTFNLAGLKTSQIVISNPELRDRFKGMLDKSAIGGSNPFGVTTTTAAYAEGQDWLNEAMAYIEANFVYVRDYLAEHLPQVTFAPIEGTYLTWLDFRSFGLTQQELVLKLVDEARVHMSSGEPFGQGGEGFMRMNIATARCNLEQAMANIVKAFG